MNIIDDIFASGVVEPVTEITSWLDGWPLGVVPITQGEVIEEAGGDTLGRLEFTLPATPEWMPRDPTHPLAPYGQELVVRRGFRLRDGSAGGWRILGRFRIRTTNPEDGWLTVVADSIDYRLIGARWIVDTTTTGTLATQTREVCAGIVNLIIASPDRASGPRTWEAQQSRRDSLLELLDAWGCVLRMIDGNLTVIPTPPDTAPDVTVRSGDGGTLVSAVPERLNDPVPNVVVASSAPSDEATPVVSAMAFTPHGPRAWDGPYGQHVMFYASPVITDIEQAQLAASTRLTRLQAKAPDVAVEAVTDPRTQLDSIRRVIDGPTDTDVVVRAVKVRHALTRGKEPGGFLGKFLTGQVEMPGTPPVAPVVRPRRMALRPSWSGTWVGYWDPGTAALFQGRQWSGSAIGTGAAWYGQLPQNIVSATVTLARGDAGDPAPLQPTMRLLAGTSRPVSGGVNVATVLGPPIAGQSSVQWDLPQAWIDQMNAGNAGGVGVGSGAASPYIGLSASGLGMTLSVTVTE